MQKQGLIIILFIFLFSISNKSLSAGNLMPADSVQKKAVKAPAGFHIVQKGNTYYSLSRLYKVPVDSLQKWNGMRLPLGATIQVKTKPITAKVAKTSAPGLPATIVKSPVSSTKSATIKPTTTKPVVAKTNPAPTKRATPISNTLKRYDDTEKFAVSNKQAQRILVVPFDPYLYFSDADNDISLQSKIPKQNVRQVFRGRLNAFIDPKGFESINLLGGVFRDSVSEMNKIYKSLSYSYQDIKQSKFNQEPEPKKSAASVWLQKQKDKVNAPSGPVKAPSVAKDENKYYGVKVKDPDLYTHFNKHYGVDYYLFINQFEIKTDYTSCLDRTTQNFVRDFLVHYTIYDSKGELIAGNKIKIPYVSNVNEVNKIVRDNLSKMAARIVADLPRPQEITPASAHAR